MITNLKLTNMVTGDDIDFSYSSGQYTIDEIDFGTVNVTQNTYKVPQQVGETLESVDVGTRPIVIYGTIIGVSPTKKLGMKWSEVYAQRKESLDNAKDALDRLISVYEDVLLEANGFTIDGRPTIPVKYSTITHENNEVMCKFEIDILCTDPLFDGSDRAVQLAYLEEKFHFPFGSARPNNLLVFGELVRIGTALCENNGDAPIGCTIVIGASGGQVVNPAVRNVETGETLGFSNLTLEDGDTLTITTGTKEENAIHHKSETVEDVNVVANLTEESVFFQIPKGGAYITYDVDEQYQNNVEVGIYYVEKYFNVRGM